MSNTQGVTIPRPGTKYDTSNSPIPGPSEASFTSTFGELLPAAQYLQTPYGQIAYYTYPPSTSTNSTSNSRILFLHGVQTPSLGLQPLATSLHTSFPSSTFVLLDLYGHGLSATPLAPHTPALFHDLIDKVLDHLNWKICHLLGYSFGAATAVGYVASSQERREKVKSLSLIAPAGLWKPASLDTARLNSADYSTAEEYVLELLEGGGPLVVPEDWQARVAKGGIVAEKVREWQMRNHAGHTASVVAIVRDGGVMGCEDAYVKAVGMGVPMVAVLGETDDVVLENDLRAVGTENIQVIKGAGHAVVRQKVDEVAKHIEDFWKGLEK